ncbi:MAG: SOS response-associated peptidase [Dermatophilaceae bacterium]
MCGRYAAGKDRADLVEEFDVALDTTSEPGRSVLANPQDPPAGTPDWNMAPSKRAPVVLTRAPRGHAAPDRPAQEPPAVDERRPAPEAQRQLRLLTWGLVPSWAKDVKVGMRMINARTESVLDKPAFATALRRRRCLVPAQAWYEWQVSPTALDAKGKPRRQPFAVMRGDGATLAMAGLYEFWRDPAAPDGADPMSWLTTFTILTTAAEPGLDRIHDRQPLVLDAPDWSTWLDPSITDLDVVAELLSGGEPGRFAAYPVSLQVNATRHNGPQLLAPAPRAELCGVVDPGTGEVIGT